MQESLDAIRGLLDRTDLTSREILEAIHGWSLAGLPSPRGGMWDEKQWGRNTWLHYSPDLEICRAEIVKGGYSSMHRHKEKNNLFIVLSGALEIHNQTMGIRVFLRDAVSVIQVLPMYWHRFIALDDTVLIEVYSRAGSSPIDLVDIERQDVGGIARNEADLFKLGCTEKFA